MPRLWWWLHDHMEVARIHGTICLKKVNFLNYISKTRLDKCFCSFQKATVNHKTAACFLSSAFVVTSRADHIGRDSFFILALSNRAALMECHRLLAHTDLSSHSAGGWSPRSRWQLTQFLGRPLSQVCRPLPSRCGLAWPLCRFR